LLLDGVSLKVRRPAGRPCEQMLVAYGVRRDGSRQRLAFVRTHGEGQAYWELEDLYRRGLNGDKLLLIVTDGCPGLPRPSRPPISAWPIALCWVRYMRKIRDQGAQALLRNHQDRCPTNSII
jgi:transposase-like protein